MRSLHSMGLLLAVMMIMITLPKGTQGHASMRVAHRGLYSSIIEANSTDSSTTSSGDDSCSQPELVEGCLVDVSCQTCLLRAGCAIETSTGKCVSASRLSDTTVGGVKYLLSGHTHYCDADDQACGSCQDGGNEALCRGADSCVCVHQCEVRPRETGKCESGKMTNITLLLPAVTLVVALCVNLYMRRTRQRQENTSSSRSSGQGRRPPAQEEDTNGPTLKLDGWRQCVRTQSEDLSNVELKGCAVVAQSKPSKPNAEVPSSGQLAHESSEDTYIQVNTPTASRPSYATRNLDGDELTNPLSHVFVVGDMYQRIHETRATTDLFIFDSTSKDTRRIDQSSQDIPTNQASTRPSSLSNTIEK